MSFAIEVGKACTTAIGAVPKITELNDLQAALQIREKVIENLERSLPEAVILKVCLAPGPKDCKLVVEIKEDKTKYEEEFTFDVPRKTT